VVFTRGTDDVGSMAVDGGVSVEVRGADLMVLGVAMAALGISVGKLTLDEVTKGEALS